MHVMSLNSQSVNEIYNKSFVSQSYSWQFGDSVSYIFSRSSQISGIQKQSQNDRSFVGDRRNVMAHAQKPYFVFGKTDESI